jgi:hypothetical protein
LPIAGAGGPVPAGRPASASCRPAARPVARGSAPGGSAPGAQPCAAECPVVSRGGSRNSKGPFFFLRIPNTRSVWWYFLAIYMRYETRPKGGSRAGPRITGPRSGSGAGAKPAEGGERGGSYNSLASARRYFYYIVLWGVGWLALRGAYIMPSHEAMVAVDFKQRRGMSPDWWLPLGG